MIFIDTSFLMELVILKQPNYEKAHKLKEELSHESVLINTTVLTEIMNKLKVNKGRPNYNVGLNKLFNFLLSECNCHFLEYEDYVQSFLFYKKYGCSINYSDCTILRSMLVNDVTKIVSFDSDFDKINWVTRLYL